MEGYSSAPRLKSFNKSPSIQKTLVFVGYDAHAGAALATNHPFRSGLLSIFPASPRQRVHLPHLDQLDNSTINMAAKIKVLPENVASTTHDLATLPSLLAALQEVYWGALEREICSLLLFYNDLASLSPDTSSYEQELEHFDAKNFEKIFHSWSRFRLQHRSGFPVLPNINLNV